MSETSAPLRIGEDPPAPAFDLDAYLHRIGYPGAREPTAAALRDVHLAHASAVPFENLDIQMGRLPIRLDLDSLQAKLVGDRRGGYCFEQNTLFAAALEALGFRVTRLAARVRMGRSEPVPRTHMLLRVEVEDAGGDDAGGPAFLADVGFGGDGLLLPVPMRSGAVAEQFAWTYRLVDEPPFLVLQSLHGARWMDLYAFTLEPHHSVDFEVANHYTSTHPDSGFLRAITVQLPGPEFRLILRNRKLIENRPDGEHAIRIEDDEELVRVIGDRFGIDLPPGTRFRALAGREPEPD